MPDLREGVTAFVIVKEEYDNIGLCLASLYGQVDEVLLINSYGYADDDALRGEYNRQLYYWKHVFIKAGYGFTIIDVAPGKHHVHFPLVKRYATTQWLFGLDGDEILRHSTYRESIQFRMVDLVRQPYLQDKGGVGCSMYEYTDAGNKQVILDRAYNKTRLFHQERGEFLVRLHGEFVVTSGHVVVFNKNFWIDHVRTPEEKQHDAGAYRVEIQNEYANADSEELRQYYLDLYASQAKHYGWTEGIDVRTASRT